MRVCVCVCVCMRVCEAHMHIQLHVMYQCMCGNVQRSEVAVRYLSLLWQLSRQPLEQGTYMQVRASQRTALSSQPATLWKPLHTEVT